MSYRPRFHLTPPVGRLNDPNGVVLVDDILHVFYQHDPAFGNGPKRTGWGHASTRLGNGAWQHHPDALYPDFPYDLHGCYSGSAVNIDGSIRLFYTGNLKIDGQRFTSQNVVDVADINGPEGGFYRRQANNPLIDGPETGFTAHFRDPQISWDGQRWRMVIGAQREDLTGAVALYESDDCVQWDYLGPIELEGLDPRISTAYMWECPNLLPLTDLGSGDAKDVLVICPQFEHEDTCGYVVGKLEGTRFVVEQDYRTLDHGHEFYAPQLIPHGHGALMLGWMGLPGEDDTPTLDAEGWVHQLTLPRLLTLSNGALRQELVMPASSMTTRIEQLADQEAHFELIDETGATIVSVAWDGAGELAVTKQGERRCAPCGPGDIVLVADGAAVEVIGGDGEVAFSLAAFATEGANWVLWR